MYLGIDVGVAPRQVIIGLVLIAASWFDVEYTKRYSR